MRRLLRGLALLAALLGCLFGLWRYLEHQMDQPSAADQPVRIQVLQGEPLRAIFARLQQQGAMRHPREVAWYLRLHGLRPRVQAGDYEIAPHASARAVLDQLVTGRVVLEQLTVVEGWRFADLRHALDAHAALAHTLRGVPDEAVMKALGHAGEAAEGRFFPDTYRFAGGTPDRRILELAYERMQRELQQAWDARAPDLPLATPTDALILASIVEKETGREDERPMVAAVFINRLRHGMRLQSDPTVIYGLGERYDGNIHTRDLETDTAYNSYTRTGLPPTPIALPGAASLRAAVHPADTDVLYFVATGNGDGSHQFSATLEQHDVALRAYLHRIGADVHAPQAGDAVIQAAHFITLEGIEGAGKSTLARALEAALRERAQQVLLTREPGGSPLAERLRALVLERGEEQIAPTAETLLMFAARSIHLENRIRPALAQGQWVLCDRFSDATRAYQGAGRGVDAALIEQLAHAVHADAWPQRTLLLDLPVEQGLARARARHAAGDRFEDESRGFFERVRQGYLRIAAAEPGRVRVIDASLGPERLLSAALAALADLLP